MFAKRVAVNIYYCLNKIFRQNFKIGTKGRNTKGRNTKDKAAIFGMIEI